MANAGNRYCEVLGIEVPRLEAVRRHREANSYSLLLVALLERGGPMTLAEVAERFDRAGIAPVPFALKALSRCRPARPPIYRDGDLYHLDPHDEEADLWAFRLDLRPPRGSRVAQPVAPPPLPGPDVPLTEEELDQAWKDYSLYNWSHQRLVLAVLDAHGGPLPAVEVVARIAARTEWALLKPTSSFSTRGSPIDVLPGGVWAMAATAGPVLQATRLAVRKRVEMTRRYARDPEAIAASQRAYEERQALHRAELAVLRRGIVHAFPAASPRAVAVFDVERGEIATFVDAELAGVAAYLEQFEVIAAIEVHALLRALAIDPGSRRLAELGPPQKSIEYGGRRPLRLTPELLIESSCGIREPLGRAQSLAASLAKGDLRRLRAGLEAILRSLAAFYQYGRLHGAVRVCRRGLETQLAVPWVHRDEPRLRDLIKAAEEVGEALEVVIGAAPDWQDPWARAERAHVQCGANRWERWLVDDRGRLIHEPDIQRARLAVAMH